MGSDGEPIICPDGQMLKVEVPGPRPETPPDIPGAPEIDDSVPNTPGPPVEEPVQPIVPRCGPNSQLVWEPLTDEASTVHSLGFDGTCDISATVSHRMVWYSTPIEGWQFDFDATGSCTGRLDDEQIQDAPVSFSMSKEYTCPDTTPNQSSFNSANLPSTLNFSGTYEPGIDTAIDVSVDFSGNRSAIRGRYSGAAELNGTTQPWITGPCALDITGTFTGQLQTLQPLQG
ncbi:MAG: hypothetical protein AABM66_03790 [Actinomycetota bacterium]